MEDKPNKKTRIKYLGRILMVLVQILMAWGYYTTYFYDLQFTISCLRYSLIPLWILLQCCYLRAAFVDPGRVMQKTVPLKLQSVHQLYDNLCEKCHAWKPPRAHHCKRCNKCIFKQDHHCEWTNNCIGALNQKYFILFLIYILTFVLAILFIHAVGAAIYCMNVKRNLWNALMNITSKKCQVAAVLLLCVFFIIFVSQLLWDQFSAVWDNQTVVESHQGKFGRQQSFMANMKQVFGENEWYMWFLPTTPRLRLNYAELVYGEEYITQDNQYLEDVIYDESNPASLHFREFMIDNYFKKIQ